MERDLSNIMGCPVNRTPERCSAACKLNCLNGWRTLMRPGGIADSSQSQIQNASRLLPDADLPAFNVDVHVLACPALERKLPNGAGINHDARGPGGARVSLPGFDRRKLRFAPLSDRENCVRFPADAVSSVP